MHPAGLQVNRTPKPAFLAWHASHSTDSNLAVRKEAYFRSAQRRIGYALPRRLKILEPDTRPRMRAAQGQPRGLPALPVPDAPRGPPRHAATPRRWLAMSRGPPTTPATVTSRRQPAAAERHAWMSSLVSTHVVLASWQPEFVINWGCSWPTLPASVTTDAGSVRHVAATTSRI